ncbi:hypothetical protein [uncultured Gimesia sp.]|uniref:hypothetical protein n=1 Tax=uncultured Gimesia sp. TaxID=1678688 RepID=UPI0026297E29|nr:hypothetical protein [uncultured Gimesia sp.]
MPEKIFSVSDAWVFTCLYYHQENHSRFDLRLLIGAADMLNHAILLEEEILSAFEKLQTTGILKVRYLKIQYSELGMEIIEKAKRTRGGLFMRVEITEKKLNSTRNKFQGGTINKTVMNHIKNGYRTAVDSYCTAHMPK